MTKLNRGQIILIKFPFVDDNLSKIRPALILEDTIDDDIIICRIT